jgi:hypothetical protein
MNKDIKSTKHMKRQTRSAIISQEDKDLVDINYIDTYYTKKKKSTPTSNIIFLLIDKLGNEKLEGICVNDFQIPKAKEQILEDNSPADPCI